MAEFVIVGFTGTQAGMTNKQKESVLRLLIHLRALTIGPYELHHGACIGADEQAAEMARSVEYWLIAWEGPDPSRRANIRSDVTHRAPKAPKDQWPKLFVDRNKKIASEVHVVIAAPRQGYEILRSGTWSTVRAARKKGKTVYLVQPDGRIDKEWKSRKDNRITLGIDLSTDRPG